MALKSYHKETLNGEQFDLARSPLAHAPHQIRDCHRMHTFHNDRLELGWTDNWYEERAAPLNGVLPRDGAVSGRPPFRLAISLRSKAAYVCECFVVRRKNTLPRLAPTSMALGQLLR